MELQKKKKEGAVTRVMAPFTRILAVDDMPGRLVKVAHLSCIAYFEVDVHFNQV